MKLEIIKKEKLSMILETGSGFNFIEKSKLEDIFSGKELDTNSSFDNFHKESQKIESIGVSQ